MLDKIIHFSIHNKFIVGLLVAGLMVWGSYSLTQLPIDAVPDITSNQVQVYTVSPSNGAEDMERFVTFPIEQTMATIPGKEEIRSISRFGLSVVTIVFKESVDIYWARQQVSERLSEVTSDIPAGMGKPQLAPVTTGLGEIFQYILRPEPGFESKFSSMELRTLQDWIVRRQLLGVEGVADVSSFGGYLKQYEITLNPERLRSMNIGMNEVFAALEKNNQNTGGSYIDKNPSAYFIRSEGLITSLQDIENIVVKRDTKGIPVLLRNVADVQFGHATRYGAMTRNTEGEVVGGLVLMLKGANSSRVIGNVKERIAQIAKNLPEGVTIEPFLDRTKLVDNAIGTVTRNLAEGALIVIFVLVLLLGNLRAGLIVASVIPLAMLFTVAMMNLFGVSGNLMSLGAIDFGLIVDGAVIIVEATMHHLNLRGITRRLTQPEMDEEVYQSASKIRNSAAFGEIIILIVYLPILALVGTEGKMFRPMAETVSFAILGAFLLSLTYVPMMSAQFLSKELSTKKNISDRIMAFFHKVYDPAIRFAVKQRLAVIAASVVLFVLSLLLFNTLGAEFIPTLEEGDFAVETRVLTGSSLSKTIDAATQSSRVLLANFPEVKEVVAKIGSSEIPIDPMPVEACDLIVILKDKSEWTSAHSREALAEKMQATLEQQLSGITYGFQQPIQMRFNELATGARQDVVVKIYGEDMRLLSDYAAQVGAIARKIEGAQDTYVEVMEGLPQVVVHFDRAKLAQFGLSIDEVNRVIRAGFAGASAGLVFEGDRRFDLVVRLDKQNRQSVEDLRNLYVNTSEGHPVPLSQLATVDLTVGPNQIQRDDTHRRILVGFNVRGRDVESIVKELQAKIDAKIKFSPGYYATYGGTFENLQQARTRLSIAVPIALALIFLLLYFTFHSLRQSLLILSAIPLSAIGGILALWLRDMPFSISAGIGFIALFGVSVLNGIVLLAEFNHLKAEGMTDLKEIVFKGTAIRLRPVIMTALVASLGFLPMALSQGGGAEVQKPLATVVIGGLISATVLTLLVLPCLYIYVEKGIKMKPHITIMLLLALVLPGVATAQNTSALPVEQAVAMALQNNLSVKAATYDVEASKSLKRTAGDVSKTVVLGTFGQYNSIAKEDNNITVSQSIPFPTVFGARGALGKAHVERSELVLASTENELAYQVKSTWYHLAYLKQLNRWLTQQDSTFSAFATAAAARQRVGETNLLEKTTAEARAQQFHTTLRQNEADIRIYRTRLQTLLYTDQPVDVLSGELTPRSLATADSLSVAGNVALKLYRQDLVVAQKETSLEKNHLLPDITFGYFNQTLIGTPLNTANNELATRSNRFQGFQLGLSIPLWFHPQASKIKAAAFKEQSAQNHYEQARRNTESEYATLVAEWKKHQESLAYYQQSALPQADLILNQSARAYRSGDIGYVEYLQGLNTATALRMGYLETLNLYNQAVLRIEFIQGQL
ncbi:CusA/CzcA family heavy metal efflux RND transporter [Chryseolinea lacunae]|uniref:CusA/CzcA family heavy metal efflux RND transporter n=1 Tax=Chryseolinea lacunae TaxID=2801331 RepID=A0ABS1L050_9BACT|nr:CusA/CzcA family heavy metal efflux RND transporter [Chryseolinea lacunae]MBL0745080.1 CusA/CzcA family heavy metal efflux RND transporter [Chryseolinea lacunae]